MPLKNTTERTLCQEHGPGSLFTQNSESVAVVCVRLKGVSVTPVWCVPPSTHNASVLVGNLSTHNSSYAMAVSLPVGAGELKKWYICHPYSKEKACLYHQVICGFPVLCQPREMEVQLKDLRTLLSKCWAVGTDVSTPNTYFFLVRGGREHFLTSIYSESARLDRKGENPPCCFTLKCFQKSQFLSGYR